MKTLFIIRGLPGSGKTTLAESLATPYGTATTGAPLPAMFAADDFFTAEDGTYTFRPEHIADAHGECQANVRRAMRDGCDRIAVHNTFTQAWEAEPYRNLAAEFGYSVFVLTCENDFGNIHEVPETAIEIMAERWEHRV
jgi:MoxR-like ATPase